jgi:hypothetical protein
MKSIPQPCHLIKMVLFQFLALLICASGNIYGQQYSSPYSQQQGYQGSTSKQARQSAIRALPMNQLNEKTRRKIASVVDSPSIYRRLPITTIDCDPDLYVFLVRYPEVVVNIWQIMGVTKMSARRTGTYEIQSDDGVGTKSTADLVYGTPKTHVYYCEGSYNGPLLLRALKARCVVVLQSEYLRGRDGKPQVQSRLDIFLKIDNMAASVIAKTVHPLVGTTADHNFVESMKFLENLSNTAQENGAGVQRLASRLTNTTIPVRRRFSDVAELAYRRAQGQLMVPTTNLTGQTGMATRPARAQTNANSRPNPNRNVAQPVTGRAKVYRIGEPQSNYQIQPRIQTPNHYRQARMPNSTDIDSQPPSDSRYKPPATQFPVIRSGQQNGRSSRQTKPFTDANGVQTHSVLVHPIDRR